MRHRRGIELVPEQVLTSTLTISLSRFAPDGDYRSVRFDMIPAWWVLGAACLKCKHCGEVDRWEIQRQHGRAALLSVVGSKLRCTRCNSIDRSLFVAYAKCGR
ncbi:MAG: hypothetical protein K5872_15970 [Rhizobiaceae bacterium]|nr:hypothetical protein [Rhizobiaceae bacterium]MCV0407720.1 hypothetical protein [Rhizobiaceae bacterium]